MTSDTLAKWATACSGVIAAISRCSRLMIAGGGPRLGRAFDAFEALMKGLGGRPHWGKGFRATPDELRAMYPETYDRFVELLARTDPAGVFRTAFVERHVRAS